MSSQVLAGQRLAVVGWAAIFAVRLAMAQTDTAWQSGLPGQGGAAVQAAPAAALGVAPAQGPAVPNPCRQGRARRNSI